VKTKKIDSLNVGDVFMCNDPHFANGRRSSDLKEITVGYDDHPYVVEQFVKCRHCGESTKKLQATKKYDAYDPSRLKGKWIVERSEMEGGGTGHGPHDVYPDGLHITARRLKKSGKYDPKGEAVNFYMSGCFSCMLEEVELVGKMKTRFV
jgi:hypothetical protein